jgi:hypothetical protein
VLDASDQTSATTDADVVVTIPTPDIARSQRIAEGYREPLAHFRGRHERFRGMVEDDEFSKSVDDEDELKLQVMLLREENARLSAALYKPADPGTLIDHVRMLSARSEASDVLDETWSILGECLALREGLDRACVEIQAAISSVRERLGKLGAQIDAITDDAQAEARRASLSA